MDTKRTNQSIGPISDRLWDFVEANVPNYHERDDVMRQAQLQLFIDGHESPVQGITCEQALAERDGILLRLYHEAIDHFTSKLPVSITGEDNLHNYAEALVDIAYEAGMRGFRPTGNSRDMISTIIAWAGEFTRQNQGTDWIDKEYLDEIYNFMDKKLKSTPSEDDPDRECDIAFLDRATLRRYGYSTDGLSDEGLLRLAGLMGNSYCNSQQFSHDLHSACQEFGLEQTS
ncbi:hypothetical protein [Alistipes shahii]|jgi:hypothetical protein|uniref:hypothetical protein n=1 Tax=uncultured Alistipes sp. TaxID=538949 RepID=UPI002598F7DA|nr:hypothetical protein [uncultured Alistipes sp.]